MSSKIVNKSEELKDVQKVCLELLIEVKRICDENNIRYFLYGGTLLGAIRHKGFIPWDDDVDIVMFREEYNKFIRVCEYKLDNDKYYLQTIKNDINATSKWCKLHKKNTAFIDRVVRKEAFKGIAIDIFAIDNAPNSKIEQDIFAIVHDLTNLIYFERFKKPQKYKSIKGKLFKSVVDITRIIPKKNMKLLYEKRDLFFNKNNSEYVIHNSFRPFKKKIVKKEYFVEECKLFFEGIEFNVPKRWDDLLKDYYGKNYMELPPEEQRICHSAKIVSVSKSWQEFM